MSSHGLTEHSRRSSTTTVKESCEKRQTTRLFSARKKTIRTHETLAAPWFSFLRSEGSMWTSPLTAMSTKQHQCATRTQVSPETPLLKRSIGWVLMQFREDPPPITLENLQAILPLRLHLTSLGPLHPGESWQLGDICTCLELLLIDQLTVLNGEPPSGGGGEEG